MGADLYSFWGVLCASFVGKTNSIGLAWVVCGQKAQEGLESNSFMHPLDGVEGKD